MAADSRNRPMPAWILLPVGSAAAVAVLITWGSASLFLGLITALVGALASASPQSPTPHANCWR
jgi:hypothetical protein